MNKEAYAAYLRGRKSSDKINYYLESQKEIRKIREEYKDRKPKLLLHACCAPCAGWPLEFLHDIFDVTIYYNNSNIWPEKEYVRRRDELLRLIHEAWHDEISVIIPAYDNETYTAALEPMKDDPEGWTRCFFCYAKRMEEAFVYAEENGFDYFTTVMTISRQKDSQKLNEIGKKLAQKHPSVAYFCSDFKKKGGQVRRDEIVEEYDLYHQDYCGCIYSYQSRHPEKKG
jgi:predicted adenine nucleotide alpha hydrolase (AANH) superfamily ATPase